VKVIGWNWPSERHWLFKIWIFKNPRWRTAAMLKIGKSPYLGSGLIDCHEIRHDDSYWPSETHWLLKFPIFETQGGVWPLFLKLFKQPHHTTTVLRPFFQDHPGEPAPEENFWTSWCKGRLIRGRHTDHPAGRHSIRTNQCPPPSPIFLQSECPSCRPTISLKALKATKIIQATATKFSTMTDCLWSRNPRWRTAEI